MNLKGLLQGADATETVERYIILGVVVGAVILGAGIAYSSVATQGLAGALALVGSFITFIFTVILVSYWFVVGDKKKS